MYVDLPCVGVSCGGVAGVFFRWGPGVDGAVSLLCWGFVDGRVVPFFDAGGLGAGDAGVSLCQGERRGEVS